MNDQSTVQQQSTAPANGTVVSPASVARSTATPKRIDNLELIETAIRTLTSFGYDTTAVKRSHEQWLAAKDVHIPTDEDARWAKRTPERQPISEHYSVGHPVLSSAHAWPGRQFTLSPGQRDVIRERYGMTPTRTIEVTETVVFQATNILHSLTIKSCQHIDDPRRTKVINQVVLCPAADFFRTAAANDAARSDVDVLNDDKPQSTAKKVKGPSVHGLVLSYLGD